MLILLLAAVLAGDPTPAGDLSCAIVKTRSEERRLGVAPPIPNPGPGEPDVGTLHFLTLRCQGRLYLARIVGDLPSFDPAAAKPNKVAARFEGDKVFLKWVGGKEAEARFTTIETPAAAKPAPPPQR
jgi:hypothetical protein